MSEIKETSAEQNKETALSTTVTKETALAQLQEKTNELITQIINEEDASKAKDLTYLFNLNQNKKTVARLDKLSALQDKLVDQFSVRVSERPDEFSNQEVMAGLKIIQDIMERGQKTIVEADTAPAPLIQINQQTNSVNLDGANSLSRESRDKVKNAVMDILQNITAAGQANKPDQVEDVIDVTELHEVSEEEN